MSSEAENNEPQSDNMEQVEGKINVEEATINLGCVKKELEEGEFEFDENCYKLALTFENIFGNSSSVLRDNRHSLIGFLDEEVIMEMGTIKLENVKEEEDLIQEITEQSDCNKCGGNYEGYCPDCSSLSHILNNVTSNIKPEAINTAPINMLEIKEVSTRQAVFALKTLPKGIIIGPFEGVPPIESTTGLQWKIKDKKLANDQNGNWMKYIESVGNHALKNLNIFQFDGVLYFETSREIQEDEELLVCYREEKDSDNAEEFYLTPVKKDKYPRVFGCTLCSLGFRLEKCLMEHKSKCTRGDHGDSSEDFQIVQCRCCKVWLEKHEHLENHMLPCVENYNRLRRNRNLPDFAPTNTDENDEITTSIDVDASYSTPPTEIIENIGTTHSNTNEKTYKCSECSHQTNHKANLKIHLRTHYGIKRFQCEICKRKFTQKRSLQLHIKDKHLNTSEKEYKCSECSYQTNSKGHLKRHLSTHKDIKHFQCDICKQRFGYKISLQLHVKNKHSKTSEMEYKCSECSHQTNHKGNFKLHLGTHSDIIKRFQCDICKQRFIQKSILEVHIKNKHSNTSEKDYKCSECSYQTNHKGNFKEHLGTHADIKHFQCDICKQTFSQKGNLKVHIKNKHSNTNEKKYKCSECSYQTNRKGDLRSHLCRHTGVKQFQCDICKQRFTRKDTLKRHVKRKHSNTSGKE